MEDYIQITKRYVSEEVMQLLAKALMQALIDLGQVGKLKGILDMYGITYEHVTHGSVPNVRQEEKNS